MPLPYAEHELAQARRGRPGHQATGVTQGDTGEDGTHRDGGDHGMDPQDNAADSVDQTDDDPDHNRDDQCDEESAFVTVRDLAEQDPGDGHDHRDRQVDTGDEDDSRLAQTHDGGDRRQHGDGLQAGHLHERWSGDSGDDEQQHERCPYPVDAASGVTQIDEPPLTRALLAFLDRNFRCRCSCHRSDNGGGGASRGLAADVGERRLRTNGHQQDHALGDERPIGFQIKGEQHADAQGQDMAPRMTPITDTEPPPSRTPPTTTAANAASR